MIHHGDLFDVLPTLSEASIDACVTDPPYGIGFMGREWDTFKPEAGQKRIVPNRQIDSDNPNLKGRTRGPASSPSAVGYDYTVKGLRGFQNWSERWAREVHRVLKPGAYLVVCGAPRSYHRMACGLEDAGFVIRDKFAWLFGQGFPKNYNLGDGKGTALKPAHEPIALAWKPFKGSIKACHAAHGTAALNADACRIDHGSESIGAGSKNLASWRRAEGRTDLPERPAVDRDPELGRWPSNVLLDEWHEPVMHLKYNTPTDAARVIREYFSDYEVSPVSAGVRDVSEQGEAGPGQPVQPEMLREVAQREPARREPSHEGTEAPTGFNCQDAPDDEGECSERREQSGMEGRDASRARLRDDRADVALREGTATVRVNGEAEQQSLHPGASVDCGAEAGASAAAFGDRPSSEREQTGQPILQPGTPRQRDSQAQPSEHSAGTPKVARRERAIEVRTLEVLESDIPRPWLIYFAPTGKSVRCGAAAMLDEQSAASMHGAGAERENFCPTGDSTWFTTRGATGTFNGHRFGDSGGASRFFYVAKPSREERNYGCEGLAAGSRPLGISQWEGQTNGNGERMGPSKPQHNSHPTVKPVELMRWLVKLVTPINGTVLDPFTGSGTTGMACAYELRNFIGIEREAEYVAIAERRIANCVPLFREQTA